MDFLEKVLSPYERKARLWPALLTLLPTFVLVASIYSPVVSLATNVITIVTMCGGLYLLATMAREYGKRKERRLYECWGGKPTTQILRHRNKHFGSVLKERFHAFLSEKLQLKFPDAKEELDNPGHADAIYEAAVAWLLANTRDTKTFNILFRENIAFGFLRNALGLKPIGISICVGCAIWVFLVQGVISVTSFSISWNPGSIMMMSGGAWLTLATCALMLSTWLFFFTANSVKTAAFAYADALIKACDTLKAK